MIFTEPTGVRLSPRHPAWQADTTRHFFAFIYLFILLLTAYSRTDIPSSQHRHCSTVWIFSGKKSRSESPFAASASLSCVSVQNVERKTSIPLPVLLLKEFDEHRGERVGVNHVGLPRERVAAGVWQDVGQRISAVVDPGVARTTINH